MHQVDEIEPFGNHFPICMASDLYSPTSDFPKSAYGTCLVGLCIDSYVKYRRICFVLDKFQSTVSFAFSPQPTESQAE